MVASAVKVRFRIFGLISLWFLAERYSLGQDPKSQSALVPTPGIPASPDKSTVDLVGAVKSALGNFPKRVVLVDDLPDTGIGGFVEEGFAASDQVGYFEIINSPSLIWEAKINYRKFSDMSGLKAAFALSQADTLLHMPKTGEWTLYKASSKKGDTGKLVSRPGKSIRTPVAVTDWIFEALGWDGVVLSQAGESLIVGSSKTLLAGQQLQALAVSNSYSKFFLTATERKGAGLLSLAKAEKGVGLFDVVFLGTGIKSLPVGTKMIIQKAGK